MLLIMEIELWQTDNNSSGKKMKKLKRHQILWIKHKEPTMTKMNFKIKISHQMKIRKTVSKMTIICLSRTH